MTKLARPDFSHRSSSIEIMDDLNCHGEVVHQTLRELEIINRWLGGNQVTLGAVKKMIENRNSDRENVVSIADLGCGGGDMLKLLADFGRQHAIPMKLTGIDANPHIIEFARKNGKDYPGISFETRDVFSSGFPETKFDIIVGTLFYHHFKNTALVDLFSRLKNQARLGLVINDIHRHWFAYYSIRLLTRLFSRSAMVRFDAPLSVLRAFSKRDWVNILKESDIENYRIRWKWAFRWQILICSPRQGATAQ